MIKSITKTLEKAQGGVKLFIIIEDNGKDKKTSYSVKRFGRSIYYGGDKLIAENEYELYKDKKEDEYDEDLDGDMCEYLYF